MAKKVFKWGEWAELEKTLGIKRKTVAPLPSDNVKKKAQIEKFSKCKVCGGQMTYIKGTNAFICDCEVEREKEKTTSNKDGTTTKVKYKVKEPCGNINLVNEEYMGYVKYLFN